MRPNKKLGQNFLLDEFHLNTIVEKSLVDKDQPILEIGAGLGSLTIALAKRARHVLAVEIDRGLFPLLQENLRDVSNVNLVLGDILEMDLALIMQNEPYSVIANIPYYLTSKLIRKLTEADPGPDNISLLVQKEVAQRACDVAPKMNLLALSIRVFGAAEITHHIPAGAFYPVPKIDSALLQISKYAEAPLTPQENNELFRLAKTAFQQKRKTLANSLGNLPDWDKTEISQILTRADIDPARRPQTLDLEAWRRLSQSTLKN